MLNTNNINLENKPDKLLMTYSNVKGRLKLKIG